MSNEMTVRGNDFPAATPNANLRVRKPKMDAEQWEAFVGVCAEAYKLIGDFRKKAAANAKLRATQIDMLNREMKLLEAEFKDEKTTKKRREEIIQRIGQLNDKMSEAMKKLDGENVGWWILGVIAVVCIFIKAYRALH